MEWTGAVGYVVPVVIFIFAAGLFRQSATPREANLKRFVLGMSASAAALLLLGFLGGSLIGKTGAVVLLVIGLALYVPLLVSLLLLVTEQTRHRSE